jgi:hypothetical protein
MTSDVSHSGWTLLSFYESHLQFRCNDVVEKSSGRKIKCMYYSIRYTWLSKHYKEDYTDPPVMDHYGLTP